MKNQFAQERAEAKKVWDSLEPSSYFLLGHIEYRDIHGRLLTRSGRHEIRLLKRTAKITRFIVQIKPYRNMFAAEAKPDQYAQKQIPNTSVITEDFDFQQLPKDFSPLLFVSSLAYARHKAFNKNKFEHKVKPNNAYAVLGVSPSASEKEIKTAYKTLASKCHPDKGGGVERMAEINKAYNAIK
jgi:hypothetical protein